MLQLEQNYTSGYCIYRNYKPLRIVKNYTLSRSGVAIYTCDAAAKSAVNFVILCYEY